MLSLSNLNDFNLNQIETHSSLDCMEYNKIIDLSYVEESKNLCNKNELIQLAINKDIIFQIYKDHIKNSFVINSAKESLKNKNYVDSSVENVTYEDLLKGFIIMITEYSKWLTKLAKNLPGLNQLNEDEFIKIINSGSLISLGFHIHDFYVSNECYLVTPNGFQSSRSRMNFYLGVRNTMLIFLLHQKIDELNLTEYEKSLYYPFILMTFNSKLFFILIISF